MHRTRNRFLTVLIHVELLIVAIIVLYPLAWIVGSSFGSGRSLAQASAIPADPTLANYIRLFAETPFATWYGNSLFVAVSNMVISVLLSAIAAYVFARLRFAGRRLGLLVMLVIQIFPTFMTAIAIYILYLNFGLLDSLTGLVIASVAAAVPYNIWLLKGYLDGISTSLDEAAVIDGASHLQIFTRILLPLMTPMLTFVAVTQFAVPWMDFILPRLLISSPQNYTVAIGLFQLISDQTRNDFTTFAAGAILVAVPITVLYMVLQRYLVAGLAQGGEKE
ncbi:sugar ABC transporter permease [Microbacterium sp. NE2HP2]|uniref:sugar ABC transporter permease n=1 Tax=Microbacterium TaxID=33882 RepID=UPI00236616D1|nr:sugar ABC transporter permease [Microbacterium plantarum]MDD7943248.1 sugar ABC transporter permease [Microbacterium plantarum]WRK18406.1 sugar ABC transporter permease [Microbacterium plantarum]